MDVDCDTSPVRDDRPFLTRRRWIILPITFALFAVFALLSIDNHHDGLMLKSAIDAAAGRVIYRDSFNQYGFLTALLQAVPVLIFGAEILPVKLLTVLFYALSAFELDRLWSRFLSAGFRWVSLAFFWSLAPFYTVIMHAWSSVFALYAMLLGGTMLARFFADGRRRDLVLSGLAAGFAFGFRQPCGVVMVIAAGLALGLEAYARRLSWREAGRRFVAWSAGAAAVPLLLAAYLTLFGAWGAYWQQTAFVLNFGWERGGGGNYRQIITTFLPPNGFMVFPLATLGLFLWCCRSLRLRRNPGYFLPLAAALLTGLASWHQYYPVPCVRHLYWGGVPMFGAVALLMQFGWQCPWRPAFRLALPLIIAAWPAIEIWDRTGKGAKRLYYLSEDRVRSDLPGMRGVMLYKGELAYYRRVAEAVAQVPPEFRERDFINLTPDGFFCRFFPDRDNWHPMFVNWEKSVYPDYYESVRSFVSYHRPVILSSYPSPFTGYRPIAGFPSRNPQYYLSVPPF